MMVVGLRLGSVAALAWLLAACFPDPPREVGEEVETTEATDADGDSAPLDTETADLVDDETGASEVEETLDADTGLETLADSDVYDASEEVAVDTREETFDAAETEDQADAGDVEPPECSDDDGCKSFDDQCSRGACEAGHCLAVPNGESTCDDGDRCTTADECVERACVGTPIVCVAKGPCFDVGTCDPETGTCSEPAREEGSSCDDDSKCTDDERCTGGDCIGTTRVCEALDQCHDAGVCQPLTGLCSNPAKPSSTPCDDGDFCTLGDFCGAQQCQPGHPPDDTLGNWSMKIEGASDDVEVHGMLETPNGSLVLIGMTRGGGLTVHDAAGADHSVSLEAGPAACGVFRLDLGADGHYRSIKDVITAPSCAAGDSIAASFAPARLADGSFLFGGTYVGRSFKVAGRADPLGTSQNGLDFDHGIWLGRFAADGQPLWVTDIVGAGASARVFTGLVADPLGTSRIAFSAAASGAIELVYGEDDAEVEVNDQAGVATGYLLELDASGRRSATTTLICAGTCTVVPVDMVAGQGARSYVSGIGGGGDITLFGGIQSNALIVPIGLSGGLEGWLAATGATPWSREFYADRNGVAVPAFLSRTAPAPNGGVRAISVAGGTLHSRLGDGVSSPLLASDETDPPDPGAPLVAYWFELDSDGGVVDGGRFGAEITGLYALASGDAGQWVLAGSREVAAPPEAAIKAVFAVQPRSWQRDIVKAIGAPARLIARVDGAPAVQLVVTSNGTVSAVDLEAPAALGLDGELTSQLPEGRSYVAIMRINSQRGLECE